MTDTKIILVQKELGGLGFNDPRTLELVQQAQDANAADKQLTIKEALKKYKKAVFWAFLLSVSLIMEGYDLVMIGSFYGLPQFQRHFGEYSAKEDKFIITAAWQPGFSNSAQVGQLAGLATNAYAQDRFGARKTIMTFMAYLACTIFIIAFAPSLSVLAVGEALCGIAWGVFQTCSITYACEVVPTILRPYVTAWVCMCWGFGILFSSSVVRAASDIQGNFAWKLPFYLQWVWPVPLFFVAYFAPESLWNAVRRGKIDKARRSLQQ